MGGYEALKFIKDAYNQLHHTNLIYGKLSELDLEEKVEKKRSNSFQIFEN